MSSASHFVGQTEQTSELICNHFADGVENASYVAKIWFAMETFFVMFASSSASIFCEDGRLPRSQGGAASVSCEVAPSITSNSTIPSLEYSSAGRLGITQPSTE